MQVSGEGGKKRDHKSSFHALINIATKEGPLALYAGFSANVTRQLAYTMTKIGLFQILRENLNQ